MTQQQLADRIGAKQSVIAWLEDAEYEGHSLLMLQKIARALNQRLEVQQGRSPLLKITLSRVVRKLANECARSQLKEIAYLGSDSHSS
ncbi:hypothetical protein Q5691_22740 [Microcoleus sp. w1-18aA5]|uniref:hypothetical protein n=1 Tax=Microcoleus sp. w1-18aA5 TaxID=2818982 RepID=UPI002FD030FF